MKRKIKYISSFFTAALCFAGIPAHAEGAPAASLFDSPLALALIFVMLLLLVIIAILGYLLVGAADYSRKLSKIGQHETGSPGIKQTAVLILLFFGFGLSSFANDPEQAAVTKKVAASIGGLSNGVFYLIISVIALEFLIIVAMLMNVKWLLAKETKKLIASGMTETEVILAKKSRLSWWDRFNKLKPISEEAELDLGHEYDGIRELNNRLPPWWLYGFYLTILFAGIYIWRFHVSHSAPLSGEEYTRSVQKADLEIKAYLAAKGEAVDENTVTLLAAAEDLAKGKAIYVQSCVACHLETGGGSVGPNLTDDFWLHGNDIKSVFKTIRYGVNAMPQWQNSYSNKEIAQVASYVKSLHGTNPPGAKAAQGIELKETNAAASDSTKLVMQTKASLN